MPDHVMRHPWSTSGHPLKARQAAPNHVRWGIWDASVRSGADAIHAAPGRLTFAIVIVCPIVFEPEKLSSLGR